LIINLNENIFSFQIAVDHPCFGKERESLKNLLDYQFELIAIVLFEDRVDFFALAHFVDSLAVEELSFGLVQNFVQRLAAELVDQP